MKIKFKKKNYFILEYEGLIEVTGEVGLMFEKEVGIHRCEHCGWKKRKHYYTLTDLATGRAIIMRGTKRQIKKEIKDDAPWLDKYKNIFEKDSYKKYLKEYTALKKGLTIHD